MTKETKTKRNDTEKILTHITDSKDEILKAIQGNPESIGRPHKTKTTRGPKETRMMKIQRTALITYIMVEKHKSILDVTLADAYHVWNDAENVDAWNEAAKRKDFRRGYKETSSLYSAVKAIAEKRKLKLSQISDV